MAHHLVGLVLLVPGPHQPHLLLVGHLRHRHYLGPHPPAVLQLLPLPRQPLFPVVPDLRRERLGCHSSSPSGSCPRLQMAPSRSGRTVVAVPPAPGPDHPCPPHPGRNPPSCPAPRCTRSADKAVAAPGARPDPTPVAAPDPRSAAPRPRYGTPPARSRSPGPPGPARRSVAPAWPSAACAAPPPAPATPGYCLPPSPPAARARPPLAPPPVPWVASPPLALAGPLLQV